MHQTMLDCGGTRAVRSSLRIAAMGTYVPERRLTNADLARSVNTTDEWIVTRTGMRERRIAREDEYTGDMCLAAARALQRGGAALDAVDYVIACTVTPDYAFPSVSARLQAGLGLRNVGAIDLGAACAGFVYGLDVADSLIATGRARHVLLVAGDALSKIVDYRDRSTCILFGDGAAAALVTGDAGSPATVLARRVNSDGESGHELVSVALRKEIGDVVISEPYLRQNGRAVYEWALTNVTVGIGELLEAAAMRPSDVDWFVPHSANGRMVESICKRTGIPRERTLTSYELHGNTSSASIPLALAPAIADGRIKSGDRVLLYGYGGGLVECGMILRWS